MGSIGGIDSQCWKQSRDSGLGGTYRAFMSDKLQYVFSVVPRKERDLPVANLKVRGQSDDILLY